MNTTIKFYIYEKLSNHNEILFSQVRLNKKGLILNRIEEFKLLKEIDDMIIDNDDESLMSMLLENIGISRSDKLIIDNIEDNDSITLYNETHSFTKENENLLHVEYHYKVNTGEDDEEHLFEYEDIYEDVEYDEPFEYDICNVDEFCEENEDPIIIM